MYGWRLDGDQDFGPQSMDSSLDAITSQPAPPNAPNGVKDALAAILEWSKDRPAWQRDAVRRLFVAGARSPDDTDELTELCKAAHGLCVAREAEPLSEEHLAVKGQEASIVAINSITHHCGVNALAPEQTISFGPNLTVVYGQNAAGKSGYTRILKRACRSRGVENILGNVLTTDAPLKPKVTIHYSQNGVDAPFAWTPDAPTCTQLARVSVFDAYSAPVYLRDKTDVAFRPYGLDVFDQLSAICSNVRTRLQEEQEKLSKTAPVLPRFPEGTRAKAVVDGLTSLTRVEDVRALSTLSSDDARRLSALRVQQRDFQSADPKQRAKELRLKSERIEGLARHLKQLSSVLGATQIADARVASERVRVAQEAVAIVQSAMFTPDLLPGTGGDAWRRMWDAATEFSQASQPAAAFPLDDGRCPFCQQTIGPEAADRLKHFAEYVTSEAQGVLKQFRSSFSDALAQIQGLTVERPDITLALSEVAVDDAELGERARSFLSEAIEIQNAAKGALELPNNGLGSGPVEELRVTATNLNARAAQLEGAGTVFDSTLSAELSELESRVLLADRLTMILEEVERKKKLAAYRQCIDDTATQQITRKSTELTEELVTDQLQKTFQNELAQLDFKHLAIEVQTAGGVKGALFHRLVFTNAPTVGVMDVLSEGESRTLSLAAFLTELGTAPSRSAIIFDDPVSSLDHVWRERIARRLVSEAKVRQVIVFTHDLLFLRLLLDESEKQSVSCINQYIRREEQSGICSPDLPWLAISVKERIGKLRMLWQSAEKVYRTSGEEQYETAAREIYGFLREAWERAITEILLNDVVERYRPSIETKKLRFLHDVTKEDCETVEREMTGCSRWIRGHDQAAADGTPVPNPAELKLRIDELEKWAKAIRQRRT